MAILTAKMNLPIPSDRTPHQNPRAQAQHIYLNEFINHFQKQFIAKRQKVRRAMPPSSARWMVYGSRVLTKYCTGPRPRRSL